MANLSTQLILSFVDRVTAPVRGISRTINDLTARASSNARAMAAVQAELVGAAAAGVALYKGIAAPVTAAADFEASMNRVEAALSLTGDEFDRLNSLAKEMGRTTQFSVNDSALAIEMLAKNGLDAAEILGGALKTSMDVAAASGADLSVAADIVTDTMYNFKIEAEDLVRVADGISGVLLASKFGIDDYRLALAQAGGVAGGLGVSLEDFNTSIAATSSYFASGSDAGTSFKTFLQRLVPGSKAAAEAMQRLNLEFFNADGSMKSMAEISEELREGLEGLSDEAKNAALQEIFGTDAIRTALALAEVGSKAFEDLQAAIANTSAAEQAAARMKGFWGTMMRLESAMNLLAVTVGEALLPALTTAADNLIPLVDKAIALAQAHPKLTAAIIGTTSAFIGLRVASIATRFAMLWLNGAFLGTAIAGLKGVAAAASLAAAAMKQIRIAVLGATLLTSIGAGGLFAGLIASLAGVGTAVAAAVAGITAPVWGLIAIVVTALAAVGIAVWKFWEPISAFFSGFGEVIGAALAEVGAAIGGFAYDRVVDLAGVFGVTPEQVTQALADVGAALASVGHAVVDFFAGLPAQIGNWFGSIFSQVQLTAEEEEGYRDAGRRMAQAIVDAFKNIGQAIGDAFAAVDWLAIGVAIGNAIWEGIKQLLPAMASGLANALNPVNWFGGGGGDQPTAPPGGDGSNIPGQATGGWVNGPGTGTSDSVLRWLSNGEYVVNAKAASRYGALLDQINYGGGLPSAPSIPVIGGGASVGMSVPSVGDIHVEVHVQSNADPNTIARAVGRVVQDSARAAFTNGAMSA